MSDISTNLSLPYIAPSQAQKHVTHNEAIRLLDSLVQLAVVSASGSEPASPIEGERFIVPPAATGGWNGHDGEIAVRDSGGWNFLVPRAGWCAWMLDEAVLKVFDGSGWVMATGSTMEDLAALGIGMAAPSGTPFAATLNDALMTAVTAAQGGSGNVVLRMNKETASDDAGITFQIGTASRALLGLFGSSALRLSVSAEGTAWKDGLIVDNATGTVSQPNLPRFAAHTNYDNFCAADQWVTIGINIADANDQVAFDAVTNRFTASVDGTYALGATLLYKQDASSSARMRAQLVKNGATVVPGSFGESSGAHNDMTTALWLNTFAPLAAGDTVELQGGFRAASGYFAADQTTFWGYKVG